MRLVGRRVRENPGKNGVGEGEAIAQPHHISHRNTLANPVQHRGNELMTHGLKPAELSLLLLDLASGLDFRASAVSEYRCARRGDLRGCRRRYPSAII